ncbi:hypothetical protein F5Y15DRAFT_426431 [Xylariaceae sp. FL0016]|nr:hypothetical protein F5Y15DRAFT_426431 [Xylariaceae sp. FL0016]
MSRPTTPIHALPSGPRLILKHSRPGSSSSPAPPSTSPQRQGAQKNGAGTQTHHFQVQERYYNGKGFVDEHRRRAPHGSLHFLHQQLATHGTNETSIQAPGNQDHGTIAFTPEKKNYTGLVWPEKAPRQPNFEWDLVTLINDNNSYEKEKIEVERLNIPSVYKNGLLTALKANQTKLKRASVATKGSEAQQEGNSNAMGGLRAVIEAAAREATAKSSLGKNTATKANRIAAFNAGRKISEIHLEANSTLHDQEHGGKKPIAFSHDHSFCSNWLTGSDDVVDEAAKYGVNFFAEHDGMDKASKEARERLIQHCQDLAMDRYAEWAVDELWEENMDAGFDETNTTYGYLNGVFSNPQGSSDSYLGAVSDLGPEASNGSYQQLFHPSKVSHTTSYTWTSPTEQQRMRWKKIKAGLRHAGTIRSPFVPLDLRGFLKLEAATKGAEQHRATSIANKQIQGFKMALALTSEGSLLQKLLQPVEFSRNLISYHDRDGMSTVIARMTIWSEFCRKTANVDWPTHKELKSEGDDRAKTRCGRYLPLPRIRQLAKELLHLALGPEAIPIVGPFVPHEYRQIAEFARDPKFDGLFLAEAAFLDSPSQEIKVSEVNRITQGLVEEIGQGF